MRTTRLQVRLDEITPTLLRVLDVPATSSLAEVHLLLQAALGFVDTHLYEFGAGEARYGPIDEDADEELVDATEVRLSAVAPELSYVYDFGDWWSFTATVLGPGDHEPGLVSGEGDEPVDDIGGATGYARAREAGELRPFDADRIGARLQRVLGRVPTGVQVVLDAIAGGVQLTPQGRLPRTVVRQIQQRYPMWHPRGDEAPPAQREDDLHPLVVVHDLVRRSRLARARHGVLSPTKSAADTVESVRRLRAAFPAGSFRRLLIETVVGILLVEGPQRTQALVSALYDGLGLYWISRGEPLSEEDMMIALLRDANLLMALGQIEQEDHRSVDTWRAGPEAGWLLPRTGLFAPES
ncbi:plasmid pRiA4b ORF-3 family protein [Actinomycetospora sp. C-140]